MEGNSKQKEFHLTNECPLTTKFCGEQLAHFNTRKNKKDITLLSQQALMPLVSNSYMIERQFKE